MMIKCLAITLVVLTATRIVPVQAQTQEPQNGPELVKVLQEEYGVISALNQKRQIFVVGIEGDVDVEKAVDRVIEIPTIEQITFSVDRLDGKTLEKLGGLPKLEFLQARNCGLEDKDMKGLQKMTRLKNLQLNGNPITDASLVHLKALEQLELLYLSRTNITGKGFKHLQSLPRLRNLYLSLTPITDASMKTLGKIYSLRVLDMHGTSISDKGVMHLAGLYQLTKLVVEAKVDEEFRRTQARARAEAQKKGLVPKNHPQLTLITR